MMIGPGANDSNYTTVTIFLNDSCWNCYLQRFSSSDSAWGNMSSNLRITSSFLNHLKSLFPEGSGRLAMNTGSGSPSKY